MYLQYGCGLTTPKEWVNYDISPTLLISKVPIIGNILSRKNIIPDWPSNVKYGNIIKGLPEPDNSCDAIYCSHVLEHLSLEDFRVSIRETQRLLVKNGTFRFVLPDLEKITLDYIHSDKTEASLTFMKNLYLGQEKREKGFKGLIKYMFENSSHRWMWDYKSIENELKNAGFHKIRRADYGDSSDRMFKLVETEERWRNCLGVECNKI